MNSTSSIVVAAESFLRSRAPRWVKRAVWDFKSSEFSQALAPEAFVERLSRGLKPDSSLLEFGCGSGNLLRALRNNGWHGSYCGVDISERAIATAQAANDPKAEWAVSAIEDFVPRGFYDAICFVESIYYVHPGALREVLTRCLRHLKTDGRIYVRICDARRHADYLRLIRREFPQVVVMLPEAA